MLMRVAKIAVLLLSGMASAEAPDPESVYQRLLLDAQRGGSDVDWRAVRQAYFGRPHAAEIEQSLRAPRAAMVEARRSFEWQELLRLTQVIISADYSDGEAHLMAGSALAQLNRSEEANKEQAISLAIFRSMLTKDGMTSQNAVEVFSVNEEYELMYARQRHVLSQKIKNEGGHSYDVLETMGKQGLPLTFWFQIDYVLANERRAIMP
jgi:hypothetical protein